MLKSYGYKNKIIQVADVLMKNKEIKRNEFVKP